MVRQLFSRHGRLLVFSFALFPLLFIVGARSPADRVRTITQGNPRGDVEDVEENIITDSIGTSLWGEVMVSRGLKWLAAHQAADGRWSFHRFADYGHCGCTGAGRIRDDTAATACVLLAFAACGHTHKPKATPSSWPAAVSRALKFLLANQEGNGSFPADITGHAQATLALCELYGLTADKRLKKPAQQAVTFLVGEQKLDGSWTPLNRLGGSVEPDGHLSWDLGNCLASRDTFPTDGDPLRLDDALPVKPLADIGWQVSALKSAKLAGVDVPPRAFQKADGFLDTVAAPDQSRYAVYPGGEPTPEMTAIGLLSRTRLGWRSDAPALLKGCRSLYRDALPMTVPDVQYHYFATGAISHHSSDNNLRRQWASWMKEILVDHQDEGNRRGNAHQEGRRRMHEAVN
jgi:hypothetical protein